MEQKTRTEILSEINSSINTNTSNDITAADVRTVLETAKDSNFNLTDDDATSVTYAPANVAHWDPDPTEVGGALDDLAGRVDSLGTPAASDVSFVPTAGLPSSTDVQDAIAVLDNRVKDNDAKVSNVSTNLGYTPSATDGVVTSSDGSPATIPSATPTEAGLMTAADKTKLDGLAATDVSYTQGDGSDWNNNPANVKAALDELAVRAVSTVNWVVSNDATVSDAILVPAGKEFDTTSQTFSNTVLTSVSYQTSTDGETFVAQSTLTDVNTVLSGVNPVFVKCVAVYASGKIGITQIYADYK